MSQTWWGSGCAGLKVSKNNAVPSVRLFERAQDLSVLHSRKGTEGNWEFQSCQSLGYRKSKAMHWLQPSFWEGIHLQTALGHWHLSFHVPDTQRTEKGISHWKGLCGCVLWGREEPISCRKDSPHPWGLEESQQKSSFRLSELIPSKGLLGLLALAGREQPSREGISELQQLV